MQFINYFSIFEVLSAINPYASKYKQTRWNNQKNHFSNPELSTDEFLAPSVKPSATG